MYQIHVNCGRKALNMETLTIAMWINEYGRSQVLESKVFGQSLHKALHHEH